MNNEIVTIKTGLPKSSFKPISKDNCGFQNDIIGGMKIKETTQAAIDYQEKELAIGIAIIERNTRMTKPRVMAGLSSYYLQENNESKVEISRIDHV